MNNPCCKLQQILYLVFLLTGGTATLLGLLLIWGLTPNGPDPWLARVLGTCIVLAVASALTMSATRLVTGRPPEDDRASHL